MRFNQVMVWESASYNGRIFGVDSCFTCRRHVVQHVHVVGPRLASGLHFRYVLSGRGLLHDARVAQRLERIFPRVKTIEICCTVLA